MASLEDAQARAVDAATIQSLFEGELVGFKEARSLIEGVFIGFESIRDSDLDNAVVDEEDE